MTMIARTEASFCKYLLDQDIGQRNTTVQTWSEPGTSLPIIRDLCIQNKGRSEHHSSVLFDKLLVEIFFEILSFNNVFNPCWKKYKYLKRLPVYFSLKSKCLRSIFMLILRFFLVFAILFLMNYSLTTLSSQAVILNSIAVYFLYPSIQCERWAGDQHGKRLEKHECIVILE